MKQVLEGLELMDDSVSPQGKSPALLYLDEKHQVSSGHLAPSPTDILCPILEKINKITQDLLLFFAAGLILPEMPDKTD